MTKNKKSAKVTGDAEKKQSRKFTAKDLVLTFVVFFSVFGFVGYFRGRSDRNKPERLRWDIFSRLALGEKNGQRVLAYQCNGRNEVTWHVDKNTYVIQRTLYRPPEEYNYSPAIFHDETLIPAFLTGGGVASIFTAREILGFAARSGSASKLTNKSYIRLIVTAALAIVSGYEVGHWIALRANYDCADRRFDQILNDEKSWKGDRQGWSGFVRIYWRLLLEDLEQQEPKGFCEAATVETREAADKKFNVAKAQYIAFRDGGVVSLQYQITSADFEALTVYGKALNEFYESCHNRPRNPRYTH